MEIDRCVTEAQQAVAEGARTIKCKTGLDPERDVELVRRLRQTLGDGVRIRVDGNEGYRSVTEAVEVTRRQEEYGILLCEQPVAGAEGLARVAERIETPVMADESAWTVHDILELHELRAAECFSCYVTKPGGLYRARQQAELAAALGIYCDIGGSIELGIGNAANLHLGAALPNAVLPSVCPVTKPAGADGPEIAGIYYLDDVVAEPFRFEDGKVMAPAGPGLGIEVDVEKLGRYAV
jgi:muconate cycloisomerase